MKIAIITTNLRLCGLSRELLEMSNALTFFGAEVTIYIFERMNTRWFPSIKSKVQDIKISKIVTDVLILFDAPHDYLMPYFYSAYAKFKTYVITGLNKDDWNVLNVNKQSSNTRKEQDKLFNNYVICADGKWQLDFLKTYGVKVGESIGGINTSMFYNMNIERKNKILISGDRRWSKGLKVVMEVVKGKQYQTYRGTRDQKELCRKYNESEIFIDNHTWGGWCNPVLEAMACGCVVICSGIDANSEFAINNETVVRIKPNDTNGFKEALHNLTVDKMLTLSANAIKKAKQFEYKIVIKRFYNYLESQLNQSYKEFWETCDKYLSHIDIEYIKDNPISWYNNFIKKIDFKNKTVLDYGIGNGLLGSVLFETAGIRKYIGIDIAQRQLNIAKDMLKGKAVEFHLTPVDFKIFNADIFVSQGVIQHFPDEQYLISFLQNVNRSNCKDVVLHIRNGNNTFKDKLVKREDWRLACFTNSVFINKYLSNYNLISESNINVSGTQYLIYKTKTSTL